MAHIEDMHGNTITGGLQGCIVCDDAVIAARSIAFRRRVCVLLVDDDGDWIVHPDGTIEEAE